MLLVADGNLILALVPVLGLAVVWAVWTFPLRKSALGLLLLVLAADYIAERPFDGFWQSPLYPLGRLLFTNLNSLTGVGPLRFPMLDFALVALLGIALHRRAQRSTLDQPRMPLAQPMGIAWLLSAGALLVMEVWGVLRGGNVKESLWQFHQLGFVPIIGFVFAAALRGERDHRQLAKVIVLTACLKSLTGIYFTYAIARPQGLHPEFATSHSDSILFVVTLMLGLAQWAESPSWKRARKALTFVPLVMMGMYVNDRRLATVSLTLSIVVLFTLMRWTPLKRGLARVVILSLPLGLLYVGAGWNSHSAVFAPVKSVRSMLEGEEEVQGPDYRDLENFNLFATWMSNPVLGSGFGHPFEEPLPLPDISFVMPSYRFQPHNTILWLWGVGGVFGFTALFAYLVVGLYLAGRVYRKAQLADHRVAALAAISAVIAYLVQCFGDMGTISWIGGFLVASSLAVVGQLAVSLGAWPQRSSLLPQFGVKDSMHDDSAKRELGNSQAVRP